MRRVAVRRVAVEEELAAAGCAHAVRAAGGAFGFSGGGSGELSHRADKAEEEEHCCLVGIFELTPFCNYDGNYNPKMFVGKPLSKHSSAVTSIVYCPAPQAQQAGLLLAGSLDGTVRGAMCAREPLL